MTARRYDPLSGRMTTGEDLAELLAAAVLRRRDEINAETAPFVGRIPFHVNIDVNLRMRRIVISVEACGDQDCAA